MKKQRKVNSVMLWQNIREETELPIEIMEEQSKNRNMSREEKH